MTQTTNHALTEARQLRAELYAKLVAAEGAVSSPAAMSGWADRLLAALTDLEHSFAAHITAVEAPDGLLAEIVAAAPRLTAAADQLRREHVELKAALVEQAGAVTAAGSSPDRVDQVRRALLELLGAFSRHRQCGSDLVYEAYAVDIGGQG